jgi:hypothetical protein
VNFSRIPNFKILGVTARDEIRILTIAKALVETRPAAYHGLWMSATWVKVMFGTSSATETLTTVLRIGTKRETDSSASAATKGTAISTTSTMAVPLDVVLRMEGRMKEESRLSATT